LLIGRLQLHALTHVFPGVAYAREEYLGQSIPLEGFEPRPRVIPNRCCVTILEVAFPYATVSFEAVHRRRGNGI
jgi:hypothetical protein